MEKFKPTVVSSEFVSSVSDAIQNKSAVVFTTSLASSSVLTDDQAMTNNFQKSKSYSQGVVGTITGYKNADTNMLVADVKISNKSLNTDIKISTVMLYGTYNGNDILVATARLNEPELLPAFDSEKGTPVTIELSVYIQVSDIENAKVQFNDAGLATNADLQRVDGSVVHKTGGEVIDGVKTFNQPINGVADINIRSLWDGYDIDNLKTTGFYVGNDIKVLQSSAKENFSLLVENAGNGSKVKQTKVVFYQSGEIKTLVRYFTDTWSLFTEVPTDDTRLVHNSGDETISGFKTFDNVSVKGKLHATADWADGSNVSNSAKHADYADKAGESGWANGAGQANKLVDGSNVNANDLDVHGFANLKNGLSVMNGIAIKNGGVTTDKAIFVGGGGINTKDGIDSYGLTYAHKDLTVDGSTKLNGDLVTQKADFMGGGYFHENVDVKSDTDVHGKFTAHADAYFLNGIAINNGGFGVTGESHFNGRIYAQNGLSISGDTVTNKIDVNGPLLVHGDVQVDGHLNGTNTREVVHMGIGDVIFWRFGHTVFMFYDGYYGDTGYTFPWGNMSGFNVPAGYRPAEKTLVTVCNNWKTTHANIDLGGNLIATETEYNRNTNIEIQGIWQTNDGFRI